MTPAYGVASKTVGGCEVDGRTCASPTEARPTTSRLPRTSESERMRSSGRDAAGRLGCIQRCIPRRQGQCRTRWPGPRTLKPMSHNDLGMSVVKGVGALLSPGEDESVISRED